MSITLTPKLFSDLFLLLLIPVLLLTSGVARAQANPMEEDGLKFRFGRKKVSIPFKLVHNLVIIPIQINNSKPMNFVVDTGVDRTLLVQVAQFDTVSLNNVEQLFLRGLGRGAGIHATLSSGNKMQFAGVEAKNQKVLVLEDNIFNLSTRLGMEVNGIIGYPLFKNFVVELDYENKVMTLYKPGRYPERKARKSSAVPLSITDSKPYVMVEVDFPDGKRYPLRLIVDSGMSSCMLLYAPTLPGAVIPEKRIEAFLGRGLNGDIHGDIARVESLRIGEFLLRKPTASFPDTLSIRYALGLNNRNGNLGADVLSRFKVVFDYANERMLLRPGSKFKRPFHYNLTGMELVSPLPGYNFYTVSTVIPNSPAERAGLAPGDALLSVNGVKCLEKTFGEILEMIQNHKGQRLQLRLSRKYKAYDVTLRLKDLI